MNINSARPTRSLTAKEQDGLLKMLFPAKQPKQSEVFTKNRTVDSLLDFLRSDTDEKPRELTQDEVKVAERVFGDMIDLGEVRIAENHWLTDWLAPNGIVMTIGNTIYGINIPDDTLIHELVHVWQYNRGRITALSAFLEHLKAWRTGQTAELYYYSVEPRQTFRKYGFEEQASIVQDAYLVLEEEEPPKRNENYKSGDPLPEELYELFMQDFREWHEELTE